IVAAVLAFGANPLAHPPDGRVIEQQRFDGDLEEIYEAIQPANVRQLMHDHRFDLLLAHAGQRPHGQQNYRPEPSQIGWSIQAVAFAIPDDAIEPARTVESDGPYRLSTVGPHVCHPLASSG